MTDKFAQNAETKTLMALNDVEKVRKDRTDAETRAKVMMEQVATLTPKLTKTVEDFIKAMVDLDTDVATWPPYLTITVANFNKYTADLDKVTKDIELATWAPYLTKAVMALNKIEVVVERAWKNITTRSARVARDVEILAERSLTTNDLIHTMALARALTRAVADDEIARATLADETARVLTKAAANFNAVADNETARIFTKVAVAFVKTKDAVAVAKLVRAAINDAQKALDCTLTAKNLEQNTLTRCAKAKARSQTAENLALTVAKYAPAKTDTPPAEV